MKKNLDEKVLYCINCNIKVESKCTKLCQVCGGVLSEFDIDSIDYLYDMKKHGIETIYSCWGHVEDIEHLSEVDGGTKAMLSISDPYIMCKYNNNVVKLAAAMLEADSIDIIKWRSHNNLSYYSKLHVDLSYNFIRKIPCCTIRMKVSRIVKEVSDVDKTMLIMNTRERFVTLLNRAFNVLDKN